MAYKPTRRTRGPNKPKMAGPDGDTVEVPVTAAAEAGVEPVAAAPAPTRRRKRAETRRVPRAL